MSDEVTLAQAEQKKLSSLWKTCFSFVLLVSWILLGLLIYVVFRIFFPKKIHHLYLFFHRTCCKIFSIRCHIKGELADTRPVLYVANHISYIDVFVLGGIIPGYFIAKSEVASWPILGWLAKLQNTLFFERKSVKVKGQLKVMTEHFNDKGNLILFPEGTSTEGEHVEPFKSSLLQSIEKADVDVLIQPVTIAYSHYKNQAMNQFVRDHYAWYGSMPFASHFFGALGMGKSDVQIILHPSVALKDFETRKECAHHCWQQVSNGLHESLQNKMVLDSAE